MPPAASTRWPAKPETPRRCTIWRCCTPKAWMASRTTRPPPSGSARPPPIGMADSQYNLGVLYARGIGVEQNLAEAYRWFGLAARGGDKESERKRDELASRLDQQSLKTARQAIEGFKPELAARSRHSGQGAGRRLGAGCGSRDRRRPSTSAAVLRRAPGRKPRSSSIWQRSSHGPDRQPRPKGRASRASRVPLARRVLPIRADARQIAARPQKIDHGPCLRWRSAIEWFYLPLGSCPNSRGVAPASPQPPEKVVFAGSCCDCDRLAGAVGVPRRRSRPVRFPSGRSLAGPRDGLNQRTRDRADLPPDRRPAGQCLRHPGAWGSRSDSSPACSASAADF